MADITFPNTFTTGSVTSAPNVMENLYAPNVTPDSMDVINGFLDRDNMENLASNPIQRRAVRKGAMSKSGMVGATANLDYFHDFYQELFRDDTIYPSEPDELDEADASIDPLSRFIPIPSLCTTIDVPYTTASKLILRWGLHATLDVRRNDIGQGVEDIGITGIFRLKINDTWYESQRRCVVGSANLTIPLPDPATVQDYGTRTWQGNFTLRNVARGRYNVGIYVCHDALQCRVRTRHIQYAIKR